jgi:hypothetical protein
LATSPAVRSNGEQGGGRRKSVEKTSAEIVEHSTEVIQRVHEIFDLFLTNVTACNGDELGVVTFGPSPVTFRYICRDRHSSTRHLGSQREALCYWEPISQVIDLINDFHSFLPNLKIPIRLRHSQPPPADLYASRLPVLRKSIRSEVRQ